jgi:CRISPR/Cas system-associated protein Cas7 (RAMP superfamily)
MKILLRNKIHNRDRSHDVTILEYKKVKLKFTYQSYNAAEHYAVDLFDGTKWNHVLNLWDLGIEPESNAYVMTADEREKRTNSFYKKACEFVQKLF